MSSNRIFPLSLAGSILLAACAAVPPAPTGTVEVALLPGQAAVPDIDGPYAAYSREGHGVIVRVWPESVRDGMVDLSIIVANTELEPISLTISDIVARTENGALEVFSEQQMLAKFDQGTRRSGARPSTPASLGTLGSGGWDSETDAIVTAAGAPSAPVSLGSGAEASEEREANAALQAQRANIADWYLDSVEIAAGGTGFGGVTIALPDSSQTILVNVLVDQEDHEFALVFEAGI